MSSPQLPEVPDSLKSLKPFLKLATLHDDRDIVVAYWCRLEAIQQGLQMSTKSMEETQFFMKLMQWLEKTKKDNHDNEAITNDVVAQAHLENWALKLFLYADENDRAGVFNKSVVQAFYTSSMIYQLIKTFGPLNEEAERNMKYAKWKSVYINNCLKKGETPVSGPLERDNEEQENKDESNIDVIDVYKAITENNDGEYLDAVKMNFSVDNNEEEAGSTDPVVENEEDNINKENANLEHEFNDDNQKEENANLDPEREDDDQKEDNAALDPEHENHNEKEENADSDPEPEDNNEEEDNTGLDPEPEDDKQEEENANPDPESVIDNREEKVENQVESKEESNEEDKEDGEEKDNPESETNEVEEKQADEGLDDVGQEKDNETENSVIEPDEENVEEAANTSKSEDFVFPSVPSSGSDKGTKESNDDPTPVTPNQYNPAPTPTNGGSKWSFDADNLTVKTEGGVELSTKQMLQAQKFIKWAGSALNYDDVPTAVTNLRQALSLLTTGKELA